MLHAYARCRLQSETSFWQGPGRAHNEFPGLQRADKLFEAVTEIL